MTRNTALIAVQTALKAALDDDVTLSGGEINGDTVDGLITGVYDARAPAGAVLPYITINAPSEVPWDTFGTLGQIVKYQINVWWDIEDTNSSLGVKTIIGAVNDVLDDAVLSIEGYDESVKIENRLSLDMPDPDEEHWHGIMQFSISVTQC